VIFQRIHFIFILFNFFLLPSPFLPTELVLKEEKRRPAADLLSSLETTKDETFPGIQQQEKKIFFFTRDITEGLS
jgi:hypothetical protein